MIHVNFYIVRANVNACCQIFFITRSAITDISCFFQISPPDPIPMPSQPDMKSNPLINSQTANALSQGTVESPR